MPALTQLSVVNDMLATMSEFPINSLDEGHPMVPTALRILATANAREQAKSWWFNKELTDLVPDNSQNIYLPNDCLRVDPLDGNLNYVQRGNRLFKPFEPSSGDKFKFDKKVRCWLVREVPFEDLPIPAQDVVSFSAQLDFMKAYEADQDKVKQVTQSYKMATITLTSEHVRNTNANMLRRRAGVFNELTDIGGTQMEADYWPHP